MKTVTIEVDPEYAKAFLSNLEEAIAEKRNARDQLGAEITRLEESVKNVREQVNGADAQKPRGENKKRIREYLAKQPNGKGARMSAIASSTGISISSTNFTLRNYVEDFKQDSKTKLWTLK